MGAFIPVSVGSVFGYLTVLGEVNTTKGAVKRIRVVCKCGKELDVVKGALLHGNTTSCGCKRKETLVNRLTTHGLCGRTNRHPLYGVWFDMHRRCTDTKNKAYKHYGLKGITVDPRWDRFEVFLADMGERPFKGATIDRIDNTKGYGPDNCKWSTMLEQAVNTSASLRYEYNGVEYTFRDLADIAKSKFGVTVGALTSRIAKGVSVKEAVETPTTRIGTKFRDKDRVLRPGVVLLYPESKL